MSLSEKNQHLDIHFDAGDIVVVKNPEDPRALQPGQVISFVSTNEVSYGETVTHMIRSVKKTDDGRVLGYVTYGTNTDTNDEALVTPEYVLGVYALRLPKVGTFFAFVKSVPGYICCILVPFLLLILYNGINVIRLFRQHKREQMAIIQAEKDQLEAERAENQRMMQELLALKAQLESQTKAGDAPAQPASEAENADAPAQNAEQAAENSDENA
jgi:signal peptidase I